MAASSENVKKDALLMGNEYMCRAFLDSASDVVRQAFWSSYREITVGEYRIEAPALDKSKRYFGRNFASAQGKHYALELIMLSDNYKEDWDQALTNSPYYPANRHVVIYLGSEIPEEITKHCKQKNWLCKGI